MKLIQLILERVEIANIRNIGLFCGKATDRIVSGSDSQADRFTPNSMSAFGRKADRHTFLLL